MNIYLIKIFDKICHQKRSIGFYSNISKGYSYSNTIRPSKMMKEHLTELLNLINKKFNSIFNGILINRYDNGKDYIGKHSDDKKGLEKDGGVIIISYGAIRKFRIRNKQTCKIILDLPTEPNKIIQMYVDFQKEFTHEIPIKKRITKSKYYFTFRKHIY